MKSSHPRSPAALACHSAAASDAALRQPGWGTGHGPLDGVLPDGGWPLGGMCEVMQPPGLHTEWQLVLPALKAWTLGAECGDGGVAFARQGVVLVGAPHRPCLAGLSAWGLPSQAWVDVRVDDPMQRLWACEQALQCPRAGAVLAWLPHAPMLALRRLQHAAAAHAGLLWVFRPLSAAATPSPAVVRLAVHEDPQGKGLLVRVLKRRGAPWLLPVHLPPIHTGLTQALAAARWRNQLRRSGAARITTNDVLYAHGTFVAGDRTAPALERA